MTVPDVEVSRGAVRLPAAECVAFVPFGVRPGAPDWCKPLDDELLTTEGIDGLGLITWLEDEDDDEEKAGRLLLLLSSVI